VIAAHCQEETGWCLQIDSVISLGDIDGDGRADLVAGATHEVLDSHLFWVSGASLEGGTGSDWELIADTTITVGSERDGEEDPPSVLYFGSRLSLLPDADGDGREIVIVGHIGSTGSYPGHPATYSSSVMDTPGDLGVTEPMTVFIGERDADYAGEFHVGLGDLDGDGLGEVVISAPGNDEGFPDGGMVYLIRSRTYDGIRDFDLNDSDLTLFPEA
jgi:hypothetical protein